MKKIFLIIAVLFILTSCERDDNEVTYPSCLQTQINEFIENYGVQSPRSNIKKYKYQNKIVFVFYKNNISDEQFSVIDSDCNIICSFGSIAGNNTCEDWESAEFIETVWTDTR
jgi:hypothetical protein